MDTLRSVLYHIIYIRLTMNLQNPLKGGKTLGGVMSSMSNEHSVTLILIPDTVFDTSSTYVFLKYSKIFAKSDFEQQTLFNSR